MHGGRGRHVCSVVELVRGCLAGADVGSIPPVVYVVACVIGRMARVGGVVVLYPASCVCRGMRVWVVLRVGAGECRLFGVLCMWRYA
ncbi:hypothetical protein DSM100238_1602 [Bifidobacterium apri]|uniref:Uncharacterized protein n=1 Tax=Bifidobacterium apri TaxID=1769423 RepID=A0A6A2VDF9_9BIFI|nr:hypothetical protein DSM100238_1602 [Bifidobacterium apri]